MNDTHSKSPNDPKLSDGSSQPENNPSPEARSLERSGREEAQ